MNVDRKYTELLDFIVQPKAYDHTGDKTICYLTFPTSEIQNVKKRLREIWLDLAKHKDLEPVVLSLHEVLKSFFIQDDCRIEDGKDAAEDEYEMKGLYADLGENLKKQEIIEQAILSIQQKVKELKHGILIITDLEAIHPFTRFGPIEQTIYNEIEVPIIVMYPGQITGSALKFLEFWPEDGNYRSKHF